jgi:hypothetical protein
MTRAGVAAALWLGLATLSAALAPPALSATVGWVLAAAGPAVAILMAGRAMAQAAAARRAAESAVARLAAFEAEASLRGAAEPAAAARAGADRVPRAPSQPPSAAPRPPAPQPAAPAMRQTPPPRPAQPAPHQAALPLGAGAETAPWRDLLRALEFPRDEADEEGMAALRSALRDPLAAQLLQAAEDVLSILAANGLHMEDLRPAHGDPAAWMAYAEGVRGADAEAVGGVREPAAVEAARTLLKADPVFRDAALVFLRRWNLLLGRAAAAFGASEALVALADTRTGRAFMLLARALGAFDAPAGLSDPA